jgi:hypothetical protein
MVVQPCFSFLLCFNPFLSKITPQDGGCPAESPVEFRVGDLRKKVQEDKLKRTFGRKELYHFYIVSTLLLRKGKQT